MRLCGQVSWICITFGLELIYPNIFVSLPEGVRDNSLEAEVTRQFSAFGTVFVKIRRDSRNMPFAFCQFTVSSV
jgi:hypothetical protein